MTDDLKPKKPTLEERKKLTLWEAEHFAELPGALSWPVVDAAMRSEIWDFVYIWLRKETKHPDMPRHAKFTEDIRFVLADILISWKKIPLDDALVQTLDAVQLTGEIKSTILKGSHIDCLGLSELIVRGAEVPKPVRDAIAGILGGPRSPCAIVTDPFTLIPRGALEEAQAIQSARQASDKLQLSGAREHLDAAITALDQGNVRDAMREAIHSVESAARKLTGLPKATLADALKTVEARKALHPAFRQALEKLYAYSNDEKGIRHSLIEASDENEPDYSEAMFFVVTCSAFVSYLARKFPQSDVAN